MSDSTVIKNRAPDSKDLKMAAGLGPYEKRLRLQKVGREYKARCPWHDDRNPSLSVYEKGCEWLWKCFPCNEGGDVFNFVERFDGVDFLHAREAIQSECGIAVPQATHFGYDSDQAAARLAEAADFLASRGIPLELAKRHRLGVVDYPGGVGRAIAIPYSDVVVKFRALQPLGKDDKFRHLKGHPSHSLLYNVETLGDSNVDYWLSGEVWVTESELDALTLEAHGFTAVSVSSATTVLDNAGKLRLTEEHLKALQEAERVFVATDQDDAGVRAAAAIEKEIDRYKVFRVAWKYGGKSSTDPKDVGELYAQTQDGFRQRIEELREQAINRPPAWRSLFKSKAQMEYGELKFPISGFLPEGVTFIGALSGVGKTWLTTSMAKALTTGQKFLGRFDVPERIPVIYLIPESSERAFRQRVDKMGIPDDEKYFLCRTMKDGLPPKLDDPLLVEAVRALKPVLFLDTAIRFYNGAEENSSSQVSSVLANGIFGLVSAGARAVVGNHHSPKASANKKEMTLENVLRGTGDLGAMCDAVYGLKVEDRELVRLKVTCVKPRDFEPLPPFHVQFRYRDENGALRSFIDQGGDVALVDESSLIQDRQRSAEDKAAAKIRQYVAEHPDCTKTEARKGCGLSHEKFDELIGRSDLGWESYDGEREGSLRLRPAGRTGLF